MAKWNVNPAPKLEKAEKLPEITDDFEGDVEEELMFFEGNTTPVKEAIMEKNETSWIKMSEELTEAEANYKKARALYLELLEMYENRLSIEKEAL